jgi:hypothetical protein
MHRKGKNINLDKNGCIEVKSSQIAHTKIAIAVKYFFEILFCFLWLKENIKICKITILTSY